MLGDISEDRRKRTNTKGMMSWDRNVVFTTFCGR